jgi:hypothetical protein
MRRTFFVTLLALAALLSLTMTPAAAIAQENVTDDAPTIGDEQSDEYETQVDSQVRVVEWSYSGGAFEIVFENTGERPTTVTVTEAVQFEEGSGQGSLKHVRLLPGETTVNIGVERAGGEAAVTITTDETNEEGYFTWLSTGEAEPDREPIGYGTVQILVSGAALGAAGMTLRVVRNRREDEEKDAERIL